MNMNDPEASMAPGEEPAGGGELVDADLDAVSGGAMIIEPEGQDFGPIVRPPTIGT